MKISVIIRAYNEDEHLEKLLLGIAAQTVEPHEVILVDSGSSDQTVEIARRYGVTIVTIDKSDFTFGRALNYGCQAASGDICVFPSAHVYPVFDNWLETLVIPFENKRVVLSYGRQIGNHINKFSEHQVFARWFGNESVCPQQTYFCNNANCAIRRSEWEQYPYDESLSGLEDLAWAKAAQARGGWIAYAAEAVIVHVHDETWQQVFNRYRREAIAMRSIDDHAKFTRLDLAWLMTRNIFADCAEAGRQGVLRKEIGSIFKFRYNQLSGTYRGFNEPPEVSAALRSLFYYPKSPHENRLAQREKTRHAIRYEDLPPVTVLPQPCEAADSGATPASQPASAARAAGPNFRVYSRK